MTAKSSPGDEDIVRYLREHPEFFGAHPELLTTISVAHRHGGKAISLQERQLEVLREKHRASEMRLAELIRTAEENDSISAKLLHCTRQLLLAGEPERMPGAIIDAMQAGFGVPQVALRLWGVREKYRELPCATAVEGETITLANSMQQPYCGPNADFQPAAWLAQAGADTRSIALLPLRKGTGPETFGLLVLGSADPGRFQMNMGTAYLERIAEVASAALSRLVE